LSKDEFLGDPGSVYLMVCDFDCSKSDKNLEGYSIYSESSSICKAAFHSGIIRK